MSMDKADELYELAQEENEKIGELLSVCERCKKSSYVDIVYRVCSGHKG